MLAVLVMMKALVPTEKSEAAMAASTLMAGMAAATRAVGLKVGPKGPLQNMWLFVFGFCFVAKVSHYGTQRVSVRSSAVDCIRM